MLDVGGGDGGDSVGLAAEAHDVTVVDPSADLLAEASAGAERAGVADRLHVVRADLADLPRLGLPPADLVVCHFVLQYSLTCRPRSRRWWRHCGSAD